MPTNELRKPSDKELMPEVDQDQANEVKRLGRLAVKFHRAAMNNTLRSAANFILSGYVLTQLRCHLHRKFVRHLKKLGTDEFGFGVRTAQRHMEKYGVYADWLQRQGLSVSSEAELEQLVSTPLLHDFLSEQKRLSHPKQQASKLHLPADTSATKALVDSDDFRMSGSVMDAVTTLLHRIITDPCALSRPWAPDLAEINFTPEEDGLAEESEWQDTAWVCPGLSSDAVKWYLKTEQQLAQSHIHSAVVCFPESTAHLPQSLFQHPIAITPEPLTVAIQRDGEVQPWTLPYRSLFVYMTAEIPDLDRFAAAFRSLAAVFSPVLCR